MKCVSHSLGCLISLVCLGLVTSSLAADDPPAGDEQKVEKRVRVEVKPVVVDEVSRSQDEASAADKVQATKPQVRVIQRVEGQPGQVQAIRLRRAGDDAPPQARRYRLERVDGDDKPQRIQLRVEKADGTKVGDQPRQVQLHVRKADDTKVGEKVHVERIISKAGEPQQIQVRVVPVDDAKVGEKVHVERIIRKAGEPQQVEVRVLKADDGQKKETRQVRVERIIKKSDGKSEDIEAHVEIHKAGDHGHAHGDHTHAHGDHTHAHGDHTHAHGDHTHAHGDHTHATDGHKRMAIVVMGQDGKPHKIDLSGHGEMPINLEKLLGDAIKDIDIEVKTDKQGGEPKVHVRAVIVGPDGKKRVIEHAGTHNKTAKLPTHTGDHTIRLPAKGDAKHTPHGVIVVRDGAVHELKAHHLKTHDEDVVVQKDGRHIIVRRLEKKGPQEGEKKVQRRAIFVQPDGNVRRLELKDGVRVLQHNGRTLTLRADGAKKAEAVKKSEAAKKVAGVAKGDVIWRTAEGNVIRSTTKSSANTEARLDRIEKDLAEIKKLLKELRK